MSVGIPGAGVEVICCGDGSDCPDDECPYLLVTLEHLGGTDSIRFLVTHPLTSVISNICMLAGDPPYLLPLCGPFPDGPYTVPIFDVGSCGD